MSKVLNIGIFGAERGRAFYEPIKDVEGVRLHAICDKDADKIEDTKKFAAEKVNVDLSDVLFFDNFDEFIDSGIDAVILTNYFHEHAQFAIKALDKGIAVMSDTTAASTMKLCVELCEAVERNNGKYMLGANVPYYFGMMELKRVYETGSYGKVKYADAEYLHYDDPSTPAGQSPTLHHWRKYLPVTYYNMHTLGPLMWITGEVPKKVNGRAAPAPEIPIREGNHVTDAIGYTFCQTENGAIFNTTGCAHMGPNGKWFRLNCTKGTLETARHDQDELKLTYVPWQKPEDDEAVKKYHTKPQVIGEAEARATHNGSDYRLLKAFVEYINGGEEPFFNVYRSVALSAAGILGWLSVLSDGKTYTIPDFTDKADREQWRDNDLTPFPNEDGTGATLPCSSTESK